MSEVRFDFCAGLYRAPSTLFVRDSVGEYRLTIGGGLFFWLCKARKRFFGRVDERWVGGR